MKSFLVIIALLGLGYFLSQPSTNKNPYEEKSSHVNVTAPLTQTKKQDCQEPSNPYDEGSGHYAGFEWGEEKGEECTGNSDSFIEGCDEYVRQENSYNFCLEQNK